MKLYEGREKPASEISQISIFRLDASIEEFIFDNVSVNPQDDIVVLPGKHSSKLVFRAKHENSDFYTHNFASVARAQCFVEFSSKPGQNLIIHVDPGGYSLLEGRSQPELSIHEDGFNKPELFVGKCEILSRGISIIP